MGSPKDKVEKRVPKQKPGEKLARNTEKMTRVVRGRTRIEVTEKLKMEGMKASFKWLKSEEVVAILTGKQRKELGQ